MGFDDFTNNDTVFSSGKSVKWLEGPIQKFNDLVPHFVESLKTHQNNILKLRRLEQWEDLQKEQIIATQITNQLASLLSEMENLRSQVKETDLNKFDRLIHSAKQSAKAVIRSFHQTASVSKCPENHVKRHSEELQEEDNLSGQAQLMAIADLSEELKVQELRAASIEKLQEDIQDVNYMFQELSQMIHEQGETVDQIETHVETAHDNVMLGERMLAQAVRYKRGMYPLLGALMGSVLGGPVGLFAGLKLGSLTAVGAGVLGFTGGKMLKHHEDVIISAADSHSEEIKNQG